MFDKLFGRSKKKEDPFRDPESSFGRYSDNNKPVAKVTRWSDADALFKEKKYTESIDAFFDYLKDDATQNVVYERKGDEGSFHLYQGSKIVRGSFNNELLKAEVTLARMPQPSVPVMRRLLEWNFSLYYSRFAMDNDRLCMCFDSDLETASPSKLYYGLKELSTKADKQDDLLVQDFAILETTDDNHINKIADAEKEVKYVYLQKWIKESLDAIAGLDADKFSGGIAYVLLALLFKIDYLVIPEGKLLNDLEKITGIYFKKDERPVIEKNRDMVEALKGIQLKPKEEIFNCLFRSNYTFAIVAPQPYKTIAESIHGANQNLIWYKDNNYPFIANQIAEYGVSFCQYSYSLPKVISEFFHLYMMVGYSEYFVSLAYKIAYYDVKKNEFASKGIIEKIKSIQEKWREKYPLLDFKTQNLRFDSLVSFNYTYTNEMEFLNMEPK
jgi:hypothetical protein